MDKRIYEVSEVNYLLKNLMDSVPELHHILIRGELSNYKIYPSGHHYFTLKDGESSLRCVMFRSSASRLKFRPESGMKVVASGQITVFPRDGAYQLYCTGLSADGIGDLYVAFEQMKEKLLQEGLFDPNHKKPLPLYPERIAIVTSSAGAAVHDMIRILRRRYPIAKVLLLPVRVQGIEAPPEIAGAIRYANRFRLADVIITGRGGGSLEDLWAFNDERVARAIYESEIPVISAVGHEPDVTIADFVADRRASTPSNAAEIAVPDQSELLRYLQGTRLRLSQAEDTRIKRERERLKALREKRVLQDPMAFLQDKRMLLDFTQQKLAACAREQLSTRRHRFGQLAASLDALSPLKVLGRGYAMAQRANGDIIKSSDQVSIGENIRLQLGDGRLSCTVSEKE
ncbi:MAG: exodeoxyribonuclease VII large subunit [Clostridiales bacterium]|nr:exodeoxyribonuclease VII large subunit [Clostridiales bacterium]